MIVLVMLVLARRVDTQHEFRIPRLPQMNIIYSLSIKISTQGTPLPALDGKALQSHYKPHVPHFSTAIM